MQAQGGVRLRAECLNRPSSMRPRCRAPFPPVSLPRRDPGARGLRERYAHRVDLGEVCSAQYAESVAGSQKGLRSPWSATGLQPAIDAGGAEGMTIVRAQCA
jgi:hypothetical protein